MNETLEAMARALFKSWFVDFDPVRAKAEGRDPGLPSPSPTSSPTAFEDSELGEIPKGWECRTYRDLDHERIKRQRGQTWFSERSVAANVPLWWRKWTDGIVPEALIDYPILLTGRVGDPGISLSNHRALLAFRQHPCSKGRSDRGPLTICSFS